MLSERGGDSESHAISFRKCLGQIMKGPVCFKRRGLRSHTPPVESLYKESPRMRCRIIDFNDSNLRLDSFLFFRHSISPRTIISPE